MLKALFLIVAFGSTAQVLAAERRVNSTLVYASQAGAALDSDLLKGGGTDDTAVLQRALDRAKDGSGVHLIIDGPALITGLNVYGNTTLECMAGGGFYLQDGSDRAVLRNAHRTRDAVVDEHITVRGCFLNGNRGGQLKTSPYLLGKSQESDGTVKSALQFFGVNHLSVEGVALWNCRTFAAQIGNAKFITIRDVTVDANLPPYPGAASAAEQRKYLVNDIAPSSLDGLHFHGPIQYLTIDGAKLRTADDALALTANEFKEDVTIDDPLGPYVGQGPITDVTISNIVLMDALQGIRLLSSNQRIDRILISNVTGTVRHRMAIISPFFATSRGDVGAVSFTNIYVDQERSANWLQLYPDRYDGTSGLPFPKEWDMNEEGEAPIFSLNSRIENLTLNNVVTKAINPRPIIRVGPVSRIKLMNVDLSVSDPQAQATPLKLIAGSHIESLNLSLKWYARPSGSKSKPIENNGGTIEQLNWVNAAPLDARFELIRTQADEGERGVGTKCRAENLAQCHPARIPRSALQRPPAASAAVECFAAARQ